MPLFLGFSLILIEKVYHRSMINLVSVSALRDDSCAKENGEQLYNIDREI
jgi:hypothetical protein